MADKKKKRKDQPRDEESGKYLTKMTKDVVVALEEAFLNRANDAQACLLAGIDPTTYYRYKRENPSFAEKVNMLKNDLAYRAKQVIRKSVESGSVKTSMWVLERLEKDEYAPPASVHVQNVNSLDIVSWLDTIPMPTNVINYKDIKEDES